MFFNPLKSEFLSQRKENASQFTKPFKETVSVVFENKKKHLNTLCGQNYVFLMLKKIPKTKYVGHRNVSVLLIFSCSLGIHVSSLAFLEGERIYRGERKGRK
jgi:hypothetical protein